MCNQDKLLHVLKEIRTELRHLNQKQTFNYTYQMSGNPINLCDHEGSYVDSGGIWRCPRCG